MSPSPPSDSVDELSSSFVLPPKRRRGSRQPLELPQLFFQDAECQTDNSLLPKLPSVLILCCVSYWLFLGRLSSYFITEDCSRVSQKEHNILRDTY